MSEQDDIRAMATRFFDAIEAGDIETMQSSFTPDAEIWHNTDELIVTPAQTAQTLTGMASRIRDREYADRQLTVFPGGFVQQHVLKGVNFDVKRGEVLGFVGASGAGKSVLLRTMIGLIQPTSGTIEVFGQEFSKAKELREQLIERHWGILFQHGALFSALTVRQNVRVAVVREVSAWSSGASRRSIETA